MDNKKTFIKTLSIGNLVYEDVLGVVEICEIYKDSVNVLVKCHNGKKVVEIRKYKINENDISPIPMTEEWLVKLNIIRKKYMDYSFRCNDNTVYISVFNNVFNILKKSSNFKNKSYICGKIMVHEFQNFTGITGFNCD